MYCILTVLRFLDENRDINPSTYKVKEASISLETLPPRYEDVVGVVPDDNHDLDSQVRQDEVMRSMVSKGLVTVRQD